MRRGGRGSRERAKIFTKSTGRQLGSEGKGTGKGTSCGRGTGGRRKVLGWAGEK